MSRESQRVMSRESQGSDVNGKSGDRVMSRESQESDVKGKSGVMSRESQAVMSREVMGVLSWEGAESQGVL